MSESLLNNLSWSPKGRPSGGRTDRAYAKHEVIKTADWVIDLGPEGGDKGGEIVAEGTPEDVARVARSYTGQYLKDILARSEPVEAAPAMKLGKAKARAPKREREAAE